MKQFRHMDDIITRLACAASADLGAQVRLAKSRRQFGFMALERLGDSEEARRYFLRSVEMIRTGLAKEPDNDSYKYELANGLGYLALVELKLGHLEQARKLYDEEMAVRTSFAPAWAATRPGLPRPARRVPRAGLEPALTRGPRPSQR